MATLRDILYVKRISQTDLCRRTGLSLPAISRAVNGHSIHRMTLHTICRELGISPEDVEGVNVYSPAETAARLRKERS